jgi:hypothetical protein
VAWRVPAHSPGRASSEATLPPEISAARAGEIWALMTIRIVISARMTILPTFILTSKEERMENRE